MAEQRISQPDDRGPSPALPGSGQLGSRRREVTSASDRRDSTVTSDPAFTGPTDPAGTAAALAMRIDAATQRLLHTAADITDEQARAASLLPGWSRGHVLTHIARNADGLRNLLVWARTGVQTPQYPSLAAREKGITAGAGRPAAQLRADLGQSAADFAAEIGKLQGDDWSAQVANLDGPGHPAWYTLWRRLSEVEIHHVDLDAGYGPADWPEDFASQSLRSATERFAGPDCPPALLRSSDSAAVYRIGPAAADPAADAAAEIGGPTRALLAWLLGRSAGGDLTLRPAGELPALPAW
jgi:maleylpyruvate isomerase